MGLELGLRKKLLKTFLPVIYLVVTVEGVNYLGKLQHVLALHVILGAPNLRGAPPPATRFGSSRSTEITITVLEWQNYITVLNFSLLLLMTPSM